MEGIVAHIQQLSLHDGRGIRTTVFLKGCDLRCRWCHNPETFSACPEPEWIQDRCLGCGECLRACKVGALSLHCEVIRRDKTKCVKCGQCAEACFPGAHRMIGKRYTVDRLRSILEADRQVFEHSGGGVTISGGEPMMQYRFVSALAALLHDSGINVCMQSNMNAPWSRYQTVLPHIDYVMCDLKHADGDAHRQWTGQTNIRILENLRRLDRSGKKYCVRTPVIPGVNDDDKSLATIRDFVSTLRNVERYQLIPFHPLASYKYTHLGLDYEFRNAGTIPSGRFNELRARYEFDSRGK